MTVFGPRAEFPGRPQVATGGLVVYSGDPPTSVPTDIIAFQFNPDQMTRSLQEQTTDYDPWRNAGDTQHVLIPLETFSLTVELDAADQLERADFMTQQYGLHPILAALELLLYPSSTDLTTEFSREKAGNAKIAPSEIPLVLFVWGTKRVVPVRVTSLSITEEAFDEALNPIRARVELGLRSMTIKELKSAPYPFSTLALRHIQDKEVIRDGSGYLLGDRSGKINDVVQSTVSRGGQ